MKLTILGSSASYPILDNPCSGYLVSSAGLKPTSKRGACPQSHVMLDIGNGSMANLFKHIQPDKLDGLVISHLHSDHFADIYSLRLHLFFDSKVTGFPVYAPKGTLEIINSVLPLSWQEKMRRVFNFIDINSGKFKIGEFNVLFAPASHMDNSYSMSIEADNQKITYTADTAYNAGLIDLAVDSDILLSEATMKEPAEVMLHLTPEEAGTIAAKSGSKKLVLTHIWPTFNKEDFAKRVRKNFDGPVELAMANKVFEVA